MSENNGHREFVLMSGQKCLSFDIGVTESLKWDIFSRMNSMRHDLFLEFDAI